MDSKILGLDDYGNIWYNKGWIKVESFVRSENPYKRYFNGISIYYINSNQVTFCFFTDAESDKEVKEVIDATNKEIVKSKLLGVEYKLDLNKIMNKNKFIFLGTSVYAEDKYFYAYVMKSKRVDADSEVEQVRNIVNNCLENKDTKFLKEVVVDEGLYVRKVSWYLLDLRKEFISNRSLVTVALTKEKDKLYLFNYLKNNKQNSVIVVEYSLESGYKKKYILNDIIYSEDWVKGYIGDDCIILDRVII